MTKEPATIFTKIKALWNDDARHRVRATRLHTEEWREREDHIPDDELPRRFPFAKQAK